MRRAQARILCDDSGQEKRVEKNGRVGNRKRVGNSASGNIRMKTAVEGFKGENLEQRRGHLIQRKNEKWAGSRREQGILISKTRASRKLWNSQNDFPGKESSTT